MLLYNETDKRLYSAVDKKPFRGNRKYFIAFYGVRLFFPFFLEDQNVWFIHCTCLWVVPSHLLMVLRAGLFSGSVDVANQWIPDLIFMGYT